MVRNGGGGGGGEAGVGQFVETSRPKYKRTSDSSWYSNYCMWISDSDSLLFQKAIVSCSIKNSNKKLQELHCT